MLYSLCLSELISIYILKYFSTFLSFSQFVQTLFLFSSLVLILSADNLGVLATLKLLAISAKKSNNGSPLSGDAILLNASFI